MIPEVVMKPFMRQHTEKIVANVIDKALSGRTSVQARGKALLMKIMEVDEPTTCTTGLLSKLLDKKPKIPPMCLDIIKEGII